MGLPAMVAALLLAIAAKLAVGLLITRRKMNNFCPVDGWRLVQTVVCDTRNMKVRAYVPLFMEGSPEYRELVQKLQVHPEKRLLFDPELVYDPEMVLFLT